MASKNDKRILELREKIAAKKEELGKSERFSPITNCSLEIDGVRYNINTLNKYQLTTLLVKVNSYLISAKDLELEAFPLSGFPITAWIADIKSKLAVINQKEEEKKLKVMEAKLEQLLSQEKKVELELDDIESFLKD